MEGRETDERRTSNERKSLLASLWEREGFSVDTAPTLGREGETRNAEHPTPNIELSIGSKSLLASLCEREGRRTEPRTSNIERPVEQSSEVLERRVVPAKGE